MERAFSNNNIMNSIVCMLNRHKILLTMLFVLLICIPAVLLSKEQIIDPYNCINLAAAEKARLLGNISCVGFGNFNYDPYRQGHLGYESILTVLISILGLPSQITGVLPIGGIIVPFLFFSFTRKIFKSNLIAGLLAIYIAYDPSISSTHYNISVYAWTETLMLAFIMITLKILDEGKNWKNIILISILFVGTFSLYWTTPFLMIFYLISLNGLLSLDYLLNKRKDVKKTLTLNLSVMFLVIYFIFNKVLYSEFIHAIANKTYGDPLDAISQLIAWISLGGEALEEYSGKLELPIYKAILILRYIVILTPIIAYMLVKLFRILASRNLERPDRQSYIFWPGIFSGLAQTLGYALRGHLSLRYISILYLPLTIISLEKLRLRAIKVLTIMLMLILTFSGFTYITLEGYPGLNKTSRIAESAKFMFKNASNNSYSLMDINTFGSYLVESIYHKGLVSIIFYRSDTYRMVIGEKDFNEFGSKIDYVVINKVMADEPIATSTWRLYEPFSRYFEKIDANAQISKIYDDSHIWVFSTRAYGN